MLSAFGTIPNLSLCVEHGHDFRLGDGEWQQLVPEMDDSWREVAGRIEPYPHETRDPSLNPNPNSRPEPEP